MLRAFAIAGTLAVFLPEALADEIEVTAITFNVRVGLDEAESLRWRNRRQLVVDLLARHAPDVIGLQEDLSFQADDVAEGLPGYGAVGRGSLGGRYGELVSVLYRKERLRLVDWGAFWLSETPERAGSMSWGNVFPRSVTWCLFETAEGARLRVYNTHFPDDREDLRVKCAEALLARIASDRAGGSMSGVGFASGPTIVLGDFNAAPGEAAFEALAGREAPLADAFKVAEERGPEHATWHGFQGRPQGGRIDHVLVTPGLRVERIEILTDHADDTYPSDHFPVLARVAIPVPDAGSRR